MAERFKAPVLKTGDPQGSVGSNPTPSVAQFTVRCSLLTVRRCRPPGHPLQPRLRFLTVASLADVAKGGDGAKSAWRGIFLNPWLGGRFRQ